MFGNLFGRKESDPVQNYARLLRRMDKKFGAVAPDPGKVHSPGSLQHYQQQDNSVQIDAVHATLLLTFTDTHMVEVRVRPDRSFPPAFSYAIDEKFQPASPPVNVQDNADYLVISSHHLTIVISKSDCHLQVSLPNGTDASLDAGGVAIGNGGVRWQRQLPPGERCYATGQRAHGLNLRGNRLALWNNDFMHYQRGSDPTYISIPFYFGLHPDYAIGILWDNPARGYIDAGAENSTLQTFYGETGELRFYVMADVQPETVLKSYYTLTGEPPLPPLWAFGYHQSRYSYKSSEEFRQIAREFRTRQIPCDVLHFDIDYMDAYRVFTWNQQNFADLPELLRDLEHDGFKSIAIIDPGIQKKDDFPVFESGKQREIFLTYPDGTLYWAPVWAGESVFPDFTSPLARSWWADQVSRLASAGFSGFWNDMNEPTVFMPKETVGTLPDYLPAFWEGEMRTQQSGGHNVYGMQMARATREGLQKARPDKRPFTLTRAAYAGSHRYTASWTGDNTASWDHLRLSISMVLNLGLSGMFFTGPDIGGFHGNPDGELYARWMQAASLLPLCRTHTHYSTPHQEPWSVGQKVETVVRHSLELRYQLLPYIYSTFVQASRNGLPPIHPTFLYDRKDEKLYEQDDVFMLGDVLLVAPVMEPGATSRQVYLPRGVWYDFWTRKLIDGARTIEVDAPLDTLPIFARAGKVLPVHPVRQYVGERQVEELSLRAYAGSGETTLYEDAGEGLAYQDGEYRWLYFTNQYLSGGQFGVDWRTAGKFDPEYKRVRLEIIGISAEPEQVLVDDQPAAMWFYEHGVVEILTDPFQSVRIAGKVEDEAASAQTVMNRDLLDMDELTRFLDQDDKKKNQ